MLKLLHSFLNVVASGDMTKFVFKRRKKIRWDSLNAFFHVIFYAERGQNSSKRLKLGAKIGQPLKTENY